MFARASGIFCCFCLISYHIPGSSWCTYHFMFKFLNRKIAYCCIRSCSLVLSASSAVSAWFRTTYLVVRGMHIISSSKIKPENRVLLCTLMFPRAFGIFCCSCFNFHHIPGSSWYTYHFVFKNSTRKSRTAVYVDVRSCFWHLLLFMLDFLPHTLRFVVCISFRLQKLNRKIAYCCIRSCSLVLLASSAVYALIPITYLAIRGIHIISSWKIKPENRVLLYTLMFARAFGIFCCFCSMSYHIPCSSWYAYHFVFIN